MQRVGLFREHPELLVAFREGKREALERVYRAYSHSIERYLLALGRPGGAAEVLHASAVADLVQDVFIRAFSADARRSYDGLRDYGGYLSGIARNCFIDALRARSREVLVDPADISFDIDDAPEPEDWCDPRTLAVLESYLGGLAPVLHGVYQERFAHGRSQEETSATLGISRRTVRTCEKELRRGLRKALARAGISPEEQGRVPGALFATKTSVPLVSEVRRGRS